MNVSTSVAAVRLAAELDRGAFTEPFRLDSAVKAEQDSQTASIRKALLLALMSLPSVRQSSKLGTPMTPYPRGAPPEAILAVCRADLTEALLIMGVRMAGPTLASKATRGGAPPSVVIGGVAIYPIDGVCHWLRELLDRAASSTSAASRRPPAR